MFNNKKYRIKSLGDMVKDPFSWNKRIPITGTYYPIDNVFAVLKNTKSYFEVIFNENVINKCLIYWYFAFKKETLMLKAVIEKKKYHIWHIVQNVFHFSK